LLSLRERQTAFAMALLEGGGDAGERIAIYRNTVVSNYRNALGATFVVVKQLVGAAFFNAAVDAYALAVPSTGGDLNVYGSDFPDFLASYPHARDLPYLADVALLEWAVDAAGRAADAAGSPELILDALARIPAEQVVAQRFTLDPSCQFVRSAYPVLRIWQVHQPGFAGDVAVSFDVAADHLVVRREEGRVSIQRLPPGAHAQRRRRPGNGAGCRDQRRTGIRSRNRPSHGHRQSHALAIAQRLKALARNGD
jgi:hypothetical protein